MSIGQTESLISAPNFSHGVIWMLKPLLDHSSHFASNPNSQHDCFMQFYWWGNDYQICYHKAIVLQLNHSSLEPCDINMHDKQLLSRKYMYATRYGKYYLVTGIFSVDFLLKVRSLIKASQSPAVTDRD